MLKLDSKMLTCYFRQFYTFCQTLGVGYRMPVKKIEKNFKPKRPIQFIEGRALVYLNKQRLSTPTLLTAHLTIPMFYLVYLMINNPWFLTFPSSLPIMGMIQFFLFIRYITHKKDNKYQVERIYLFQNGNYTQFWLANKIRRRLKDTPDSLIFAVSELKSPPIGENELPLKFPLFPEKYSEIQHIMTWHYGWYKYDSSRENYIIPKKFEYANWEILIPMMKGIEIDTTDCPKTPIPIDKQFQNSTLEEAIKEAEDKIKYEQQWQKENGVLKYSEGQSKS